jgi:hypothetical protein
MTATLARKRSLFSVRWQAVVSDIDVKGWDYAVSEKVILNKGGYVKKLKDIKHFGIIP